MKTKTLVIIINNKSEMYYWCTYYGGIDVFIHNVCYNRFQAKRWMRIDFMCF